jgi:hypothetical protein
VPISQVKPVLIDNIVMRRRSAWEPIIRHHIMLAPYTRSLRNGSTVHSLTAYAVEILSRRNLSVRSGAIYSTQVARDTFMVSPR